MAVPGRDLDAEPGEPVPAKRGLAYGVNCKLVEECESELKPTGCRKARRGKAKVRTGLGKTDCPGSQGGLWKRGLWRRLRGHVQRKRRDRQAVA